MRLFLAIDLPLSQKKSIYEQLKDIRLEYPQFSWVSLENYHITVHFYGETDRLATIKKKLKDNLYDQKSLYLYATDCDLFIHKKITIYLNFRREKNLELLAQKIYTLPNYNFNSKRRFVPHLTLARCKIPSKQQYFVLKKRLEKIKIDVSFKVSRLFLFKSILGGNKPVYKKIANFPFPS